MNEAIRVIEKEINIQRELLLELQQGEEATIKSPVYNRTRIDETISKISSLNGDLKKMYGGLNSKSSGSLIPKEVNRDSVGQGNALSGHSNLGRTQL